MARTMYLARGMASLALVLAVALVQSATSGATSTRPVLGFKFFSFANGFGTSAPRQVQYGGDGYSFLSSIRWKDWGVSQSSGTGFGWYVPTGLPNGSGNRKPVDITRVRQGPLWHRSRLYAAHLLVPHREAEVRSSVLH